MGYGEWRMRDVLRQGGTLDVVVKMLVRNGSQDDVERFLADADSLEKEDSASPIFPEKSLDDFNYETTWSFRGFLGTAWEKLLRQSLMSGRSDIFLETMRQGSEIFSAATVKKSMKKKEDGLTFFHEAAKSGMSDEVFDVLFKWTAPLNALTSSSKGGVTPLAMARKPDVVKKLLSLGADLEKKESISSPSPLHCAVQQKNPEKIGLLLAAGASVNSEWLCKDYNWKSEKLSPMDLLVKFEKKSKEFEEMAEKFVSFGNAEALMASARKMEQNDVLAILERMVLKKMEQSGLSVGVRASPAI